MDVKARIERASETGCLVLNNMGLTEIPEAVFGLSNLRILVLGNVAYGPSRRRFNNLDQGGIDALKRLRRYLSFHLPK